MLFEGQMQKALMATVQIPGKDLFANPANNIFWWYGNTDFKASNIN